MAMVKKVPKTLLLGLAHLLCVATLSHATSLSFSYNFSTPGALTSPDLKYLSNATAGGDRVDLTKNTSWSTGRVAYGRPVQLWDDTGKVASFTSNFTFVIKSRNHSAQGDGMAFFVGTYPPDLPQDSNGGFLGLVNNPSNPANTYFPATVAVEFDAFRNDWDPKDTMSHVGVDVNNISSVAYAALPDGCFNGAMSAWVRYDANASTLSATLRFDDQPGLGIYNVSAPVDLRAEELPRQAAVGFSAATGDYVESHQILSWSFESTLSNVAVINKTARTASKSTKTTNIGLIAGLASAGIVILLIVAAWLCYREYQKRKGTKQGQASPRDMDEEFKKGTGPRRFTYRQLSRATRRFSDDAKLGEGGFGSVYRGFLQDQGLHVAIKRVSKASKQGRREYISELVGWCHEGNDLLLVYELMTNGSLDTHLYSTTNVLTWPIRYNIILGMGSALLYLHQEWEQCVVHRDIKPSNVMLDSSFNAKLGDFGLARLVSHARDAHTTMVAGTRGYIDPECAVTCRATTRSDVYSFGVLLLEIACGRKPVVPEEDESKVLLVRWVWELYGRGELLDAADARLLDGGESGALEVERTLVVGLWCVHPDSASRPSIRQAMNVLQFEAPLPELPPEMPVATYGPPVPVAVGGGYQSSNTTSTSGTGSANSRTARESNSVSSGMSEQFQSISCPS
ncbi:hypothetical protein GQ55_7G261000 [Panicum hallii var. hallii]|uniref:Protein kinase domain-containing protein n=1 Tax=Panicum hallii var. hallii TaxID=1504633 RepID=A0A2T7CZ54_9POAL|nr:hypothetical protein GQ55_7G261000 [Panicum hallii var. hallii]